MSSVEIKCQYCNRVFDRDLVKFTHEARCASTLHRRKCVYCNSVLQTQKEFNTHVRRCQRETPLVMTKRRRLEAAMGSLYEIETSFGGDLKTFFLPCSEAIDVVEFLCSQTETLHRLISEFLTETDAPLKYNLVLEVTFENVKGETCDRAFKTKNIAIYNISSILDSLSESYAKLATEMEEMSMKGSGWFMKSLDGLLLRENRFRPLGASSYIPLPAKIAAKKAVINVINNDERCFKYAILSRLVEGSDPQRVSKYERLQHEYNFDCISFPTPLQQVETFEKHNNISVNVFAIGESGDVYPIKVVQEEKVDHRDLLLLTTDDGRSHYTYIKNFNKLVASQISSYRVGKHVCKRCFSHFNSDGRDVAERISSHTEYCGKNKPTRIVLPACDDRGNLPTASFININRQMKIPFVVYADFESILKKIPPGDSKRSQTIPYQRHLPMSFCTFVKIAENVPRSLLPQDFPAEPYIYTGEDSAGQFLRYIKEVAEKVSLVYSMKRPMLPLTTLQTEAYAESLSCYLCSRPFTSVNGKVKDHDHITGMYRGPAHSQCNILYRTPRFLPVLFHNLGGYDAHFIVRELGRDKDFILNPFDKRSACWNLLPEIRHVGQIKTIVQSFIPDGPSSESRIWNEAARIALSGMLEKLMHEDAKLSNAEIANKILKTNLKDVAALLKGTHARSTFDMSSPKTAASVMFVLSSHLNSLRLSKKQTEKSFSLRNWMESDREDSFLFITSQASLNSELVPLQTAWYEIIINSVLSKEPSNASKMKKTWIIIDELGSMNKIPSLADGLSVARSFGGCFVLGTQNISQLRSVYGVDMAKSISSECNTRCIFRTNDPETARWLSENIGDTETIEYKEGVSYGAHAMRDGVNLNMNARSKNLVMPSEIQNLADLNLFLKIPGHSIVKASVKYEKYQQKAERFIEDTEMIASLQSDYTAADDEDEEIDDLEVLDKVSDSADDLQSIKKKQKVQKNHEVTHKNTKQTRQNKELQTLHTDKNNIFNWE